MQVLIVDDSRAMRMILKKMMGELGHKDIDEAEHGQAALDHLEEKMPDVALVDWNMPVMGGEEFISTIRGRRDCDQIKVLVVTSESNPRVVYQALKAGADEYAMKPLTTEVIGDKLGMLGLA
ncbi:MAG: response regulator [Ilumatobacteraceae bacterium]|nr:response regulator [Ilumatobacteraceae bacterium]